MKKGVGSISQRYRTDPGIRIRTKMSRIPNTALKRTAWLWTTGETGRGCEEVSGRST